jgi:four helix bundle protein
MTKDKAQRVGEMPKGKGQMSNEGPKAKIQTVRNVKPPVRTTVDYPVPINGEDQSDWILRERPPLTTSDKVYDLMERTATFGGAAIQFSKRIPRGPGNDRLSRQLVGAGTRIGANHCEADDAVSKKDFQHKIGICRKEAKECKFWLRMIATAEEALKKRRAHALERSPRTALNFCEIFHNSRIGSSLVV